MKQNLIQHEDKENEGGNRNWIAAEQFDHRGNQINGENSNILCTYIIQGNFCLLHTR